MLDVFLRAWPQSERISIDFGSDTGAFDESLNIIKSSL